MKKTTTKLPPPPVDSSSLVFVTPDSNARTVVEQLISIHFWSKVRELVANRTSALVAKGLEWESALGQAKEEIQGQLDSDEYVRNRLYADAASAAFDTQDAWQKLTPQVKTIIASWLEENGLLGMLEANDVLDFLASKTDPNDPDARSINWEIERIVHFIIPLLKINGFEDDILSFKDQYSKARAAASAIQKIAQQQYENVNQIRREILRNPEDQTLKDALQDAMILDDEQSKLITEIISGMSSMTVAAYKEYLKGVVPGATPITKVTCREYDSTNGTVFVIHTSTKAQRSMIEGTLFAVANNQTSDIGTLVDDIIRILNGGGL